MSLNPPGALVDGGVGGAAVAPADDGADRGVHPAVRRRRPEIKLGAAQHRRFEGVAWRHVEIILHLDAAIDPGAAAHRGVVARLLGVTDIGRGLDRPAGQRARGGEARELAGNPDAAAALVGQRRSGIHQCAERERQRYASQRGRFAVTIRPIFSQRRGRRNRRLGLARTSRSMSDVRLATCTVLATGLYCRHEVCPGDRCHCLDGFRSLGGWLSRGNQASLRADQERRAMLLSLSGCLPPRG
jgi:hypothetical protein